MTSMQQYNHIIVLCHAIDICDIKIYAYLHMHTQPRFKKPRFCETNIYF